MPIPKMEIWKFTNRMGKSSKLCGKGVRKKLVHHSTSIDFGSLLMPADVFHHPQIFGEPQHFDLSPSQAPMKPPAGHLTPGTERFLRVVLRNSKGYPTESYGLPALIFRHVYPLGDIHLSFGHHGEKILKLQAFGSRREKDAIAILRQQ